MPVVNMRKLGWADWTGLGNMSYLGCGIVKHTFI